MIWISELKTDSDIHLPGYKLYRNTIKYNNHGGIALFIKDASTKYNNTIEFCGDDGIYVSFSHIPNIIFSGWYVPPSDSLYYTNDVFASLSSKIHGENRSIIIFGDFNAKIRNYNEILQSDSMYNYKFSDETRNSNGDLLKSICIQNKLVIVNGLTNKDVTYDNKPTYKKKNNWISKLDFCIVSENIIPLIDSFEVIHGITPLPSDHAIITCSLNTNIHSNYTDTLTRATNLNETETPLKTNKRKQVKYDHVNIYLFKEKLDQLELPEINSDNIELCDKWLSQNIYESAISSMNKFDKEWDMKDVRWKRLISTNDSKYIWNAINWKGDLVSTNEGKTPSPIAFKHHFQKLLLTEEDEPIDNIDIKSSPYIPVLDDPITSNEIHSCVKEIKPNKANDTNGNSPGIIKLFTPILFYFLLCLFNTIFQTAKIPISWTISKLIVLFKKGNPLNCGNYRGISVNDIFFRLYDKILAKRLSLWYKPCVEQAGSQKGRNCIEHIMTLRLFIDYAKISKLKLYILFIDFEKAYDKIVRRKLIERLKDLGCGYRMINNIIAIYKCTKFIFQKVTFFANLGVRQGSSTSSLLFILYVDKMIQMVKNSFNDDGFTAGVHILMLMDDTILLSTSKSCLTKKF